MEDSPPLDTVNINYMVKSNCHICSLLKCVWLLIFQHSHSYRVYLGLFICVDLNMVLNVWLPCDLMLVSNWLLKDSPRPINAFCVILHPIWLVHHDTCQSKSRPWQRIRAWWLSLKHPDANWRIRQRQDRRRWRRKNNIQSLIYKKILSQVVRWRRKAAKGAWTGPTRLKHPAAGRWPWTEFHPGLLPLLWC